MPINLIAEAPPPRKRLIFAHCERPHIAGAAPVEIAGVRVMDGVALAPAGVGRQRHYPKRSSDKIIGSSRREEGTVAAVMLDRKKADQQQGCRRSEWQHQPGMAPRAAKQSRHE